MKIKKMLMALLCVVMIGCAIWVVSKNANLTEDDSKAASLSQEDTTDDDSDGVPNWIEEELGSDLLVDDTDGDGLTDYQEIFVLSSDPTIIDTDGDGISDAEEDFDGDSIGNLDELSMGTNPISSDTDGDGLKDNEEIYIGTETMLADSDVDGAEDGWEVEHGYDPLSFDQIFLVNESLTSDAVTANVVMETSGSNADTVRISKVENSVLLNENMPGYIGSAFNFESEDSFDSAMISFEFDADLLNNESFNPTIYYFNEDTQLLEELETVVSGNVASTSVEHFSTYVLLDKADYDAVWIQEIREPDEADVGESGLSVVFVLDRSHSMSWNDPGKIRNTLTSQFIEELSNEKDYGSVISFVANAESLTGLTHNINQLKNAVQSIVDDSGYNSNSGTNGSVGIYTALQQLKTDESENSKYVVFMTDGEDNRYTYSYESLIQIAVEYNIKIYSIGLGTVNNELLQSLATGTGGKYYYAAAADELMEVFGLVESETIDYHTDSNNDGISDYYTRLLCEGTLVAGSGVPIFKNCSYEQIQSSDDYDGDGLKNGEEITISVDDGRIYVQIKSSPELKDTDSDGIDDAEDTAPLEKGLEGGITGELTLVSCYESEDAGWVAGHAFFTYKSYINDTIDFSELTAGWSRINNDEMWSTNNIQQDEPSTSSYFLKVGEIVTIGNGALDVSWFGGDTSGSSGSSGDSSGSDGGSSGGSSGSDGGSSGGSSGSDGDSSDNPSGTGGDVNGVCYNMEIFKHFSNNYLYLSNTYIAEDITGDDLNSIIAYCGDDSANYWTPTHNCATVATEAWNLISETQVDPYNIEFMLGTVATPKGLKINLRTLDGYGEDYSLATALEQ